MIGKNINLINIPPFVLNDLKKKKFSFLGKILLIFKGKILSYAVNHYQGKVLCSIVNFFYNKNGKIFYENSMYYKNIYNSKFYYPNTRFLRVVNDEEILIEIINESYCLDFIDFNNNDIVIDCGANVGELKLALNQRGILIDYYAFEPDETVFKCLQLNSPDNTNNLHNIGLSNANATKILFIDSDGGNSSFIDFGSKQKKEVESIALDSLNLNKNIKLFKVEAEGFEPEVLYGSKNTLKIVDYISVDFGSERGKDQSNTVTEVNKFLYENNFSLVSFSNFRTVGLYRNNKSLS
tara:strand:+ start:1446 stop:2327 length:882 start_codon:yes stop_codon:yes gene_type:complete